jgi:hypothetical protein
MLGFQ